MLDLKKKKEKSIGNWNTSYDYIFQALMKWAIEFQHERSADKNEHDQWNEMFNEACHTPE
jgi:hypothetical protein